jgi:Rhs element Vgr protein
MSIIAEKIEIKIDGKTLDDYVFSEFRLTQELQKPNELCFRMYKNTLAESKDDIRFSLSEKLLGKKVEFSLTTKRDDEDCEIHDDEKLEFTGIVFNAKLLRKSMKEGLNIEVTAYSPDFLLTDNPHCYTYENETLKNIVSKIVEPYDAISMENNPRMEDEILYTVQYNETNYGFLSRLAYRFGEWLYYDGNKLVFGKINKQDKIELKPGYDVLSYQYRVQLQHLNFTHAHHNYLDYENRVNEECPNIDEEMHNMTDIAYEQSKDIYSEKTFQHLKGSTPEENNYDETEISAQVQAWGKKEQLMICRGSSNRADLKIGSLISIKEDFKDEENETGSCAHDELLICGITHYADMNGNYENDFTAIPADSEYPPYKYCDRYPKIETQRAVVKDNKDPEKLGRVRVQFLWQKEQDENLMTPWLRIAQPHGGDNKGFYFIPEIEEEVMVAFENGNAEKPYVTGTLYQGEQRPGENWYDENNKIKAIRTKNGHTIEIHDEDEGGFIKIYDNEKGNYILTFSTDDKLIKLQSSGNIELFAENDIILDAKNNIKIKAGMDMSKDAGENINETAGKNVTIGAGENMAFNSGNDMDTSVGKNNTLYVSSNQFIEIGENKNETIAEKYQLTADTMRQEAKDKMMIYSKNHEQKAEDKMKFDGGKGLDLFAKSIKMN